MQGIPDHSAVAQPGLLQLQTDPPLLRLEGQDRDAVLQRGTQVEGLLGRRRPAALQLAHLKDVVHQREQMLRRHADLLLALSLPLRVVSALLQDGQHPQDPVEGRAQVVGHMGEEFALGRIRPPHPLQELHDGLLLLLPRHHGLGDVLMVSVHAGARLLEGLVRHTAAADIDLPQGRMVPGVDHLGAPHLQHLPDRLLHHLDVVGLDALEPVAVALLRPDLPRQAQEDPHGPVGIHPGLAALLQLDRPDTGPGPLQDVLQALPGLQLILLLLLHHSVHVPLRKDRAVL